VTLRDVIAHLEGFTADDTIYAESPVGISAASGHLSQKDRRPVRSSIRFAFTEHAVDGRPNFQVDKADRMQLLGKRARPVVENVRDRHGIGDPEREVQVGEAVAASHSEGPHGDAGDDALVVLGELEHSRTQRVPLLDREHSASILEKPTRYRFQPAPVAQWIEQRFPKPRALVRFRPGALSIPLFIPFFLLL
jgi:hypothetical protein